MVAPGWAQPGDRGAGLGVDKRVSTVAPFCKKKTAAELVMLDEFNVFAGHAALVPDVGTVVSCHDLV